MAIGYDSANRRTSLTLPNGVVLNYGYDAASLLTTATWLSGPTTLGNLTYGYDSTGRRVQVGGTFARVNLPAALASATYNTANQLTQWGSTALTYDLNGNLTSDGTNSYTWDARNQLSGVSGGVAATFQYDALGRRTQNAAGTGFLYDGLNPLQELSGSNVTANLLTGLGIDEVFSRTDSGGTSSLLTDALGNTVALTDSTGAVQRQYTYEPFGNTTATGPASSSAYQYTGRENDGTGLYYYRARYYSPKLQRFISEDPAWLSSDDFNPYEYVYNNPTNLTDPSGEIPLIIGVGLIGGAFGAVDQAMTAYSHGQSASGILTKAGQGFVAGGAAAVGAALAFGLTGNPYASGAATATIYDVALGKMTGQMPGIGNLALDAALGALTGGLARGLTPRVPGAFPNLFSGRPLSDYGPKSMQVLKGTGLGSYLGALASQLKNMFGRQCLMTAQ